MPSPLPLRPSAESPIRLVVVAELRLYREGLAQLLGADAGFTVVGTAGSLDEAASCCHRTRPDVAVLDLRGKEGHECVRALSTPELGTRVVAIAVPESDAEIVGLAEAGISGFVTENESLVDLTEVIVAATRGELRCTPRAAAALLRKVATGWGDDGASRPRARLTPREKQVVRLMAEGLANKQIALRLSIEHATVKNHVHNILEKVGARTRTEAATVVRTHGLVPLPSATALDPVLDPAVDTASTI